MVTRTQQDGSLAMRLIAVAVEQDTRDDSIKMNDVSVNYFRSPQTEWILTAQNAASCRPIRASCNSKATWSCGRPNAPSASYLRTEALAVDTEKNLAYSTRSPVTMQVRSARHARAEL